MRTTTERTDPKNPVLQAIDTVAELAKLLMEHGDVVMADLIGGNLRSQISHYSRVARDVGHLLLELLNALLVKIGFAEREQTVPDAPRAPAKPRVTFIEDFGTETD